jgi:hypothetical protein
MATVDELGRLGKRAADPRRRRVRGWRCERSDAAGQTADPGSRCTQDRDMRRLATHFSSSA